LRLKTKFGLWIADLLCLALLTLTASAADSAAISAEHRVHTYYIAADEVEWDYARDGIDKMMGMKLEGWGKMFTERGSHSIGKVYRKAIYREYTGASFSTLKPRPTEWEHLGILGSVLRAEVGDTIRVVFRNNATRPYSMHLRFRDGEYRTKRRKHGRTFRNVCSPLTWA
jgi:manganese oxidase